MKKIVSIVFLAGMLFGQAQTALYNSGNIRIHEEGQLGFHTNLINNASFDENLGLAGFYGSSLISVTGAFAPVFFDTEIANDTGVQLNTSINVANNTNFVVGDFITPRNSVDIYYNFLREAFYVGSGDGSKVDGYATITDQESFTFPVGDSQQLRPLILNSASQNSFARCAYFFEDPNNPSTFPGFDTALKPRSINAISNREFWRLEGSVSSSITISWNSRSDITALAAEINEVTIMGWNKQAGRWLSLGNAAIGGDLTDGFISSETFVPDDFEVITFGSLAEPEDILTLDNYFISPNGDGINDVLVIEEMELSPNNSLRIFNRDGLKVFEMINYTNEFGGISNVDNLVINREQGLPEGVYFYVISLDDLGLNYQGFLYLDRD
ncbi:gliding motility-associated C-terminal domain-containing protein [uncultured Eudoraea sp.]|uniref:gliding motility-associated C-terminal domain-containing protein n=1 Tax=uncultured Eudoraea sp. TaxID=1035614 RepID=UPI00261FD133|nr:gliding motility-associated C-terminal domain-containing protein [uncultured Eudoraea sp.]